MIQTIDDRYAVNYIDGKAFQTTGDVEYKNILLTSLMRRGDGTEDDPHRIVYRVYENDKCILELDFYQPNTSTVVTTATSTDPKPTKRRGGR